MKTVLFLFLTLSLLVNCSGDKSENTLKVGDMAPSFNGLDLNGNSFNLRDFSGEPVLIRFWETGCKYCKADTPVFNTLNNRFKDSGLHIAYINTLSNLKEVQQFVDDMQVEFPVLMDEGGVIAKLFHVRVVPQTIIINRQHQIIAAITGGVTEDVILDLLAEELL